MTKRITALAVLSVFLGILVLGLTNRADAFPENTMFWGVVKDNGNPVPNAKILTHGPDWSQTDYANGSGVYYVCNANKYQGFYCLEAQNSGDQKRASTWVEYTGSIIRIDFDLKTDGSHCTPQDR